MRIQPAGIGQQPNSGRPYQLRLFSNAAGGLFEGLSIGTQAHDCQALGVVALDFLNQPCPALRQLIGRKLTGRGARSLDDIGQAQPELGQGAVLAGIQALRGESRLLQDTPKTVAGVSKVMADGG